MTLYVPSASLILPAHHLTFNLQTCTNCCIGQHELLTAISEAKDTLHLPLSFELEHMPFRLISDARFPDGGRKVDKSTFYMNMLGKEKFTTIEDSVTKWANERGMSM